MAVHSTTSRIVICFLLMCLFNFDCIVVSGRSESDGVAVGQTAKRTRGQGRRGGRPCYRAASRFTSPRETRPVRREH